jgi:hypothetical protein
VRAARRRQRRKIGRNEKRLSCHFLQESIAEAYPTHSYMLERLYPRLRSFAITILLGVRSGKTGVTLSAGEPGHGCQFLSNVTTSGSAAVPLSKTYAFPQAFFRPRQDSLVWRACRCQGLRSNPKGLVLTATGSELHSLRKRPERTPVLRILSPCRLKISRLITRARVMLQKRAGKLIKSMPNLQPRSLKSRKSGP